MQVPAGDLKKRFILHSRDAASALIISSFASAEHHGNLPLMRSNPRTQDYKLNKSSFASAASLIVKGQAISERHTVEYTERNVT